MLVTRFSDSKKFIGRLDAGQDIAAGFKVICRENSVNSAWISAVAIIRCPVVSTVSVEGTGPELPRDGVFMCASISGSVSLAGPELDVRLYADCVQVDGPARFCGLVKGGEVLSCEFMLTTCEEAALVRDSGAPFAPWVQLHASPGKGSAITEPLVTRTTPSVMHQVIDEDEMTDLNILEMKAGDYVDHPKFGVCRIATDPVEDRISIRLPTGKQVDLSLGIMRVLEPKQVGGRRVFKLEIKRKGL